MPYGDRINESWRTNENRMDFHHCDAGTFNTEELFMRYEGDIAQGLVDEIMELVYKYSESMLTATAIGCLEIAKMQILNDQVVELDDDDD
jgi:hypothetical protein